MKPYNFLKSNTYSEDDYNITPLREQDILYIKEWRNAQIDVLRQKKVLTDEDQTGYYNNIVKATFTQQNPTQILFSFLKSNNCIGYGGLTNIDWESKRVELSFLLDVKRILDNFVYANDFSAFISLMKIVVFEDLEFNRIFTETFDIRPFHISILEKNGFVLEGRMRQHIIINGNFVDSLIHGFLKEQYVINK